MKIAVTYEEGKVFQHFGHTEHFKFYEVEDGKVTEHQVDVLICGGIGGGAQAALAEVGIKLYGGVTGEADQAVEAFLNEALSYDPNVKCSHHEGEHEHHENCAGGGCGSGHCGH